MVIKLRFLNSAQTGEPSSNRRMKSPLSLPLFILCWIAFHGVAAQTIDSIIPREITFTSEGIRDM